MKTSFQEEEKLRRNFGDRTHIEQEVNKKEDSNITKNGSRKSRCQKTGSYIFVSLGKQQKWKFWENSREIKL